MEASQPVKIIIVGKTGAGKSTLACELIGGRKAFAVSSSLSSQTKKCQIERGIFQGQQVEIIDTPGFLDSSGSDQDIMSEIFRCLATYSQDGFNICVMPISAMDPRLDGGTVNILQLVTALLTQKSLQHMFIVITQLNNLNQAEQTRKIAIIEEQLPQMLYEKDLGDIANLFELIFYKHGSNPSGLESLATILPIFKKKTFIPKLDDEAQFEYMRTLLQNEIQASAKERQQMLDDAEALKESTISGAQHIALWKLILKKTMTESTTMPCSKGHDLFPSQKDKLWFADGGETCVVCNDDKLGSYKLFYICPAGCPEDYCAVCYHKFGLMQTTEKFTPDCLKTTRVSCHPHPMRRSFCNYNWRCDGKCGYEAGDSSTMQRYSCPNCDYDLCQRCLHQKQI